MPGSRCRTLFKVLEKSISNRSFSIFSLTYFGVTRILRWVFSFSFYLSYSEASCLSPGQSGLSLLTYIFSHSLPRDAAWVSALWAVWPPPTTWSQMKDQGSMWYLSSFSSWFTCELADIFTSWTSVISLGTAIWLWWQTSVPLPNASSSLSKPTIQSNKKLLWLSSQRLVCLLILSSELEIWGYLYPTFLSAPFKAMQWIELDFLLTVNSENYQKASK